MASLLLLSPLAHAGSYGPAQYAGGRCTLTGNPDPVGYVPVSGGWGYPPGAGYGPTPVTPTLNCSGAIQISFAYTPAAGQTNLTDPPPAVIITETCQTSWSGTNGTGLSASGSCSNPLGGSATNASPGPGQNWTATSYSGMNGAATVSPASRSPGATATGTATAQATSGGVIQTVVVYTASVSPATINLQGTTPDANGNPTILVGQGCTASLSGIPTAPGWSATYAWSVSGNTFQKWTVNIDGLGNPSSATLTSGPGPLTNPTAHWYWSDKKSSPVVTCMATLSPPAGQGAPFTITVNKTVNLQVPTTTENATTGRVQINNLRQGTYGPGYALYAGNNAAQPYGIIYTTQVNTPTLFSAGTWNMVQIVTPNTWTTKFGQPEVPSSSNGFPGLDGRYPFYPSSNPSYPTGVPANNLKEQPYDGPAVLNLQDTIKRYRVADHFDNYVMFLPPGSDTQWVPLWDIDWSWSADDSMPGIRWTTWNNAVDAGSVGVFISTSTIDHPTWFKLIN